MRRNQRRSAGRIAILHHADEIAVVADHLRAARQPLGDAAVVQQSVARLVGIDEAHRVADLL